MALLKALFDQGAISCLPEGLGQADVSTLQMCVARRSWISEYYSREPTKTEDPCQRMPYAIVHKLEKGVFAEYDADIRDKAKTNKGAWMQANLAQLNLCKNSVIQWLLIVGEVFLKPVPHRQLDGSMVFEPHLIRRDNASVLGRTATGQLAAIGTVERSTRNSHYYTLLEKRSMEANGYLTIENTLYRSTDKNQLGGKVPLATLPDYATLPDRYTYPKPLGNVGLISLRTPLANCVDGSLEAISIYEPAMGLIRNINRNEKLLNDEFELGRHRIIAPAEMLKVASKDGPRILEDNIFIAVEEYRAQGGGLTTFSPELRDAAYERRKQSYLRSCENVIGMKRGMLSDAQEVEKTAFEIASTAGDYNLSLIDLQRVWFDAVRSYLSLCDLLGQMYRYCDQSYWAVTEQLAIRWGNGVLYDPDKEWAEILKMVQYEMLRPEIALAWKYDLPWETPKSLAEIRSKYMPELDNLLREAKERMS